LKTPENRVKLTSLGERSPVLFEIKWFNTQDAAVYLSTTPKQIRNWVYQGKIRAYRLLGRNLRFKKQELDSLLKGEF
jgi:excisionase family DNA binding protein